MGKDSTFSSSRIAAAVVIRYDCKLATATKIRKGKGGWIVGDISGMTHGVYCVNVGEGVDGIAFAEGFDGLAKVDRWTGVGTSLG
mmetsp:Transcript_7481/g.10734  ORF Transcript_7481/g.10734 Transcript_7481/m.10734 type:complete len:85 (-) Transcript_7481:156-410(-)